MMPDGRLLLRAGVGWKSGSVDKSTVFADSRSAEGFTLQSGEPVVVADLATDTRFKPSVFMVTHGVVSGVTITVPTQDKPFGVFCVHTTTPRTFTTDEVQFLLATVTAIGIAVQRKRADAELQKLAAFAQLNPNPALEFAADGSITYFNDAAFKLASSIHRNHPHDLLPPDIEETIRNCLATGRSKLRLETALEGCTLSWSFHPMLPNNVVHCYIENITERFESGSAVAAKSQKMESVGQRSPPAWRTDFPTTTHAHDHPGDIQACCSLRFSNLAEDISEPVQAVYFAAERAAGPSRSNCSCSAAKRSCNPVRSTCARNRRQHGQNAAPADRRKHHTAISGASGTAGDCVR